MGVDFNEEIDSNYEQRVKELTALNDLARDINSSLLIGQVLSSAYEHIRTILAPDLVVIYLRDDGTLILPGEVHENAAFREEPPAVKHICRSLCGRVDEEGMPVYAIDIYADHRCMLPECPKSGMRSFAALPLTVGKDVQGVLGIGSFNERDFSRQSVFLEALSNQIAIALKNAALHEKLEDYSGKLDKTLRDLVQSEAERMRAHKDWGDIFQAIGHSILILDVSHTILMGNQAAEKLTGMPQEELSGKKCHEVIHRSGAPAHCCPLVKMIRTGRLETQEMQMEIMNGRVFLVSCTPVFDENGMIEKIIHISTDITDRQRAENSLRESEQRLMDVINFLPDPTFVIDKDKKVLVWNLAMEELSGVKAKDMLGKGDYEYAVPFYGSRRPLLIDFLSEDPSIIEKYYTDCERHGDSIRAEAFVPGLVNGGAHIWGVAKPLYNSQGDRIGAIESIRITTERKLAEETIRRQKEELEAINTELKRTIRETEKSNAELLSAQRKLVSAHELLQQSEEKFSKAFHLGPVVVTLSTLSDGRYVEVSDHFLRLTEYSREEVIGHSSFDLGIWVTLEDRARIGRIMESSGSFIEEEILFRSRSGKIYKMLFSAEIVTLMGIQHMVSVAVDLTERKRAEEALRESEEKYRILFENASEAILVTQDGMIRFLNPKTEEILGYPKEEIVNIPFGKFIHPDDRDMVTCNHKKRLEGEALAEVYSFRVIDRQGNVKWVEVNAVFISWEGRPATLNFYMDITKRKLADEAIRKSEERYRTIFEHTATANLIVAEDTTILLANSNIEKLTGYAKEELEGKMSWKELVSEQDLDRTMTYHKMRRFDPSLVPNSYELCFINQKGQKRDIFMNVALIPGTQESIASVVDITELKQSGERIRKNEELYRTIFENTGNASILVDDDDTILLANSDFQELSGYSKKEIEGCMSWIYFVYEKDLKRMREYQEMRRKEPGSAPGSYEFRFINRRGEKRDISVNVALIAGTNESVASLMDITEQKRMVEALRESEERYRTIFENATEGIFQTTPDGRFLSVNLALARMFGYSSPQEMIDTVEDLEKDVYANPADRERLLELLQQKKSVEGFEFEACHKDGSRIWISTNIHMVQDARGNVLYFEGTNMDITKRKQAEAERSRLEEQLLQAQKMESVGRLAGGVAHDFNNMLTPIMGYTEMLLDDLAPDDPRRDNIEQVIHSAERSRDLVRQLLAFARKQTLEMKPVNLNKVMSGVTNMLRHTLHENVKVEMRPAESLGVIQADTGQLEQIILNLAVNAQDAMPEGGFLVIETSEVVLDNEYSRANEYVTPGTYVMMSVSDTGTGMDKEILQHAFEPFYTTKGAGKGTGLGLATVYGIVKQHGGHISVHSEPGTGTTFRIFFPRYGGVDAPSLSNRAKEKFVMYGTETILVVEDEENVRNLAVDVLKHYGYTVLEASDGKTAREVLNSCQGVVHLLLTDVILPDMNGRKVYEELSLVRQGLKALYMSGYTADVISHHGVLEKRVHFIQKPFSLQDLAQKVREVIDGE